MNIVNGLSNLNLDRLLYTRSKDNKISRRSAVLKQNRKEIKINKSDADHLCNKKYVLPVTTLKDKLFVRDIIFYLIKIIIIVFYTSVYKIIKKQS